MNKFHYFCKTQEIHDKHADSAEEHAKNPTWVNIILPTKSMKSIWPHWRIIKDIAPQMKSIKMFCTFVRVETRPQNGVVFNAEDLMERQLFSYTLPCLSFSEKKTIASKMFQLQEFYDFPESLDVRTGL